MSTNIGALGEEEKPWTFRLGEDLIDGIAFLLAGAPVALDGIDFRLQIRRAAADRQVFLEATTDNGLLAIRPSTPIVAPANPGVGYAIGDTIRPAGGVAVVPMTLTVTSLALVALTCTGSGPNFAPGNTIALGGGIAATPAVATVDTVDAQGHVLTAHVSTPGFYSVAAATFSQVASNGNGTGATFANPVWGVAAAAVADNGIYSVLPASPLVQGSTSGAGVGATFAMTFINNGLAILVPAADLPLALVAGAYVYAIQALADGATATVLSGPVTALPAILS